MSLLDRVLIDPTPDDLAGIVTGKGIPSGEGVPEWRAWFAETASRREGKKSWSGRVGNPPRTIRVEAVWWTDWVGRRHWRVMTDGSLLPVTRQNSQGWAPPEETPPAGVVYPGWVSVRRSRDGRVEAVAACNCGAVGTLAQLAWMGPHCGPCHDRAEEAGGGGSGRESCHYLYGGAVVASQPAFSADGRLLAVATPESSIRVWDVVTGREWASLPHRAQHIRNLTFSPDGQLLLATEFRTSDTPCRIFSWDLVNKAGLPPRRMESEPSQLCFAPTGRRLAIPIPGGLEVWNLVSRNNWRLDYADRHDARVLAFDTAGNRLLVGSADRGALIDLKEKQRYPIDFPRGERLAIHDVAFDPRGEPLLLALESPRWSGQGLLRLREGKGAGAVRLTLETRTEEVSEGRGFLTPDARHVVYWDAPGITLRFWGAAAGAYLGELWWCGGYFGPPVMAADGTLVTALLTLGGNLRLWPWRALLGLPPSR